MLGAKDILKQSLEWFVALLGFKPLQNAIGLKKTFSRLISHDRDRK